MASLSEISSEFGLARAALKAGDYPTALIYAISAQSMAIETPDAEKDGSSVKLMRQSIGDFIANIRRLHASSVSASKGIQQMKITYKRPDASGDYE